MWIAPGMDSFTEVREVGRVTRRLDLEDELVLLEGHPQRGDVGGCWVVHDLVGSIVLNVDVTDRIGKVE
jgi:hypothetical protein